MPYRSVRGRTMVGETGAPTVATGATGQHLGRRERTEKARLVRTKNCSWVGLDGGKKRRTIKFVWQPKGNSSLARQVHVIHSPSEANVDTPPLPASCFDRINLHSDWRRACA